MVSSIHGIITWLIDLARSRVGDWHIIDIVTSSITGSLRKWVELTLPLSGDSWSCNQNFPLCRWSYRVTWYRRKFASVSVWKRGFFYATIPRGSRESVCRSSKCWSIQNTGFLPALSPSLFRGRRNAVIHRQSKENTSFYGCIPLMLQVPNSITQLLN